MSQQLGVLAALEEVHSVLRTHLRRLTAACNSSSLGIYHSVLFFVYI